MSKWIDITDIQIDAKTFQGLNVKEFMLAQFPGWSMENGHNLLSDVPCNTFFSFHPDLLGNNDYNKYPERKADWYAGFMSAANFNEEQKKYKVAFVIDTTNSISYIITFNNDGRVNKWTPLANGNTNTLNLTDMTQNDVLKHNGGGILEPSD